MCKGEALPSAHRCRDRRDFVAGIKEGSIAKNGLFRQAHAEHPIRQNGCIDAHVPDEFLGLLYRTLLCVRPPIPTSDISCVMAPNTDC